jgi:hypothetical protein
MKTILSSGLVLLVFLTSLAGTPKRRTLAIYLIAGSVDARLFVREPERWKDLPLESDPIISNADIIAYDFSKHAMRVRPETLKRLPHPSVAGVPFVLVVNGERIYPGAFYTMLSSIPCDLPVIVVDRFGQNHSFRADVLLIENAYPQTSALRKDLRSDVRVKDALASLKKLAAL